MEFTVLSEDEIFQDEEQAMSAISHLLVNQHKGRIKGKFVLGAREHTGFPIFATYFGFWVLFNLESRNKGIILFLAWLLFFNANSTWEEGMQESLLQS